MSCRLLEMTSTHPLERSVCLARAFQRAEEMRRVSGCTHVVGHSYSEVVSIAIAWGWGNWMIKEV